MIRVNGLTKVYSTGRAQHVVLNGLDFEVRKGQRVGLLGRNGAGKSTLVRLLGKIEVPTRGLVEHHMSVSWPIGFSGSFQGSLTGLDNMKFISRIYQVDYGELRAVVEDFAELGKFLYEPVKTYSSGMRARLAFGLSIAIKFDCYLIDEVTMVGDQRFHERCQQSIYRRDRGHSIIFASHNINLVRQICDQALVLDRGEIIYFGSVGEAVNSYMALQKF